MFFDVGLRLLAVCVLFQFIRCAIYLLGLRRLSVPLYVLKADVKAVDEVYFFLSKKSSYFLGFIVSNVRFDRVLFLSFHRRPHSFRPDSLPYASSLSYFRPINRFWALILIIISIESLQSAFADVLISCFFSSNCISFRHQLLGDCQYQPWRKQSQSSTSYSTQHSCQVLENVRRDRRSSETVLEAYFFSIRFALFLPCLYLHLLGRRCSIFVAH